MSTPSADEVNLSSVPPQYSQESNPSDDGEHNTVDDHGHGAWGNPNFHWGITPPPDQHSPPPAIRIPRPLVDPREISIPETKNLLQDLRDDFNEGLLTWYGQEWRPTHLDELDSMAWDRIQGKTMNFTNTH